jgi:hypothetical protein
MPTLVNLLLKALSRRKRPSVALEEREVKACLLELEPEMKFIRKRLTLANFLLVEDLMEAAFIYGKTGCLDQARAHLGQAKKGKRK